MSDINSIIAQARSDSFQDRATNEGNNISILWWLSQAGLSMPPWWSPARDEQLRKFWKKVDHLAGAVYSMEAKMTAIPFTIVPKDMSDKSQMRMADAFTDRLYAGSEYGDGWVSLYGKWIEDVLTCDNGGFMEVIGAGNPAGPLVGAPVTVAHLDSWRCTRTGNPEYPVIYTDTDGKRYKLHYSRVMYHAQMASPIVDMFGVGLCAVSRSVNVSQSMLDILIYKQEKLGSRPHRSILVTRGGLDPMDVKSAFEVAGNQMDAEGLSRYSKIALVGSSSILDADIREISLATLPDGFNEETSITYGMAAIALAFGMDARELFPSMAGGGTRADALIQHLKQRGKGPGQIIQATEMLFNYKFLPPTLKMVFDFQDDAQDRQVAEIKQLRSNYRQVQLDTATMDKRTVREQMLQTGDIDREQFERLELEDGRLEDGTPIITLFYSADPAIAKYLDVEKAYKESEDKVQKKVLEQSEQSDNEQIAQAEHQAEVAKIANPPEPQGKKPTPKKKETSPDSPADNSVSKIDSGPFDVMDTIGNDKMTMLAAVQTLRAESMKALSTAKNNDDKKDILKALAALNALEKLYKGQSAEQGGKPAAQEWNDTRVRTEPPGSPTSHDMMADPQHSIKPSAAERLAGRPGGGN